MPGTRWWQSRRWLAPVPPARSLWMIAFAFVFTFKGDRVVREQAFRNREEALEAAGLSDSS